MHFKENFKKESETKFISTIHKTVFVFRKEINIRNKFNFKNIYIEKKNIKC